MEQASSAHLREWFAARMPNADDVAVDGIDAITFGHSAETVRMTLSWCEDDERRSREVVLRLRPPPPGLLEPYDLQRQYEIIRALEGTPVRAPRALWYEGSGDVLGREFYVMEHVDGTVYEHGVPDDVDTDPARIRRMSQGVVDQIAAIHLVDLHATGLDAIGDGKRFLDRELEHWSCEMRRVQRGPLPALERLLLELREQQPPQSPRVTLVHGDPKPGNFAFKGDRVSAIFDWELATLGDPLADIGWAEFVWAARGSLTSRPGALTPDELVARYQDLTGIAVENRAWYRAFQGYKLIVILLVAAMLFDSGFTNDPRFAAMGRAVHPYTMTALASLGIDEDLASGPVLPRESRMRAVRTRNAVANPSLRPAGG